MATLPTILVTGSNGQLGSELRDVSARYPQCRFVFADRTGFSLNDLSGIAAAVVRYAPQYLVNCAAYTAVDKAETDREEAYRVNAEAVGLMAAACAKLSVKFIHISTDYVFDGNRQQPLTEEDSVAPVNYYGESKLAGERLATEANKDAVIIRTSWVYSSHGKNFVKTMVRLMAERESVNVVADQWGSPTYAADLAEAIMQIVETDEWRPGIYHFSNEGVINWAQFAKAVADESGSSCRVKDIATSEYPTPAARPAYSVMDTKKIVSVYQLRLQPWRDSLRKCIEKLRV